MSAVVKSFSFFSFLHQERYSCRWNNLQASIDDWMMAFLFTGRNIYVVLISTQIAPRITLHNTYLVL